MPFMQNLRMQVEDIEFNATFRKDLSNSTEGAFVHYVKLKLVVDGEKRFTAGEANTGYHALHKAFANALKSELGDTLNAPRYPADEMPAAMMARVFYFFNDQLEKKMAASSETASPLHPSERVKTASVGVSTYEREGFSTPAPA